MSVNHVITDEQFSEQTTIDGNRLDRAVQDVVDYANAIPKRDLRRRAFPQHAVFGFQPCLVGAMGGGAIWGLTPFPFMPETNDNATTIAPQPPEYRNPHRVPDVLPDIEFLQGGDEIRIWWAWSQAWFFSRPVTITDLAVFMLTDSGGGSVYENTFEDPVSHGDLADIILILHVDYPFGTEDRRLNNIQIERKNFHGEWFNSVAAIAPVGVKQPAWPGPNAWPQGKAIICDDLNIPLPMNSRARLALCLPHYGADLAPWDAKPYLNQCYSGSLTWLEDVE